jgi:tetratricopeptide (TPR) repeat protein
MYLKELTKDELKELVREIAKIENNEEFLSKMDEYAQKIDAVGVLTGGSPRMAILLYELMSKGKIVGVEQALFKLLDENTPYYQDVFRLLSSQKRKVFDTLISIGKPATPKEIAKKARLDEKVVNTQLRRLEKDGYVISRRMGKTTKYEVRERLFRLWRELRRQPFAMQKLSILVEFLELWYSIEERKEKFLEYLREASDETRAREASYWFLSLPKEYKIELMPQVVKGFYEAREVKLLDEFMVYEDRELKAEAIKTEFMILLKDGKYKEGLKKAEEMIKRDEKNAIVWAMKGVALRNLERYEEALEAFSKSTELNPELAPAWFYKGKALGAFGRYEEALDAFSKSIEVNPEDADAWLFKGAVLVDLERYEEALQALSKSIELNPENAFAWGNKGIVLEVLERSEEALEAFSKSIELNPEDVLVWNLKGGLLGGLGRSEEALDAFSKSIELNPEDAAAWLGKGMTLRDLERPEEALKALSIAVGLNPKDALTLYVKGTLHLTISVQEFENNNYGNALENLEFAIDAFDAFSTFLKDKEKAKEEVTEAFTGFLKELIDTKNVETVEMALLAMFEKKNELKELFKPIYIAVEIVRNRDVSKYYDLQVEMREVVADIVKKLTGSEELLPE